MVDVWIVSADAFRRRELESMFGGSPVRVVGTAPTLGYLSSLMDEGDADVALVDVGDDADPEVVHDWLVELEGRIGIVVLTREPAPALFRWLSDAGGGGLLWADAEGETLLRTVEAVASGLAVFDASVARPPAEIPGAEALTPRESEVLRLLADGLANREIAERMGISGHTIKFHIRSILGKLGASTRTEAVSRGLRSGLIDL